MNPIRGNFLRSLGVSTAAILILVGCGDKEQSPPKQYNVAPKAPAVDSSGQAPVEAPAGITSPSEKAPGESKVPGESKPAQPGWAAKSALEKREVYIRWLQDFKRGTPDQRRGVLSEINSMGLPPADAGELEKLRQHYGVPALR